MHPLPVPSFVFFAMLSFIFVSLCTSALRHLAVCNTAELVLCWCVLTTCISGSSFLSTYSTSFLIYTAWAASNCIRPLPNGLSSHRPAFQTFLDMHQIDIALVSETHFTSRTVFRLPRYTVYHTIHPDDTAHGGAAVILRSSLRHHELLRVQTNALQAIAVRLEALPWPLTVSAVYYPPRHSPPAADYAAIFQSLGPRFLVGGDWNAKHTAWGARLTTPKGRTLFHAISGNNCTYYSTGEPTYWPTDPRRLPDLLDFFVARGMAADYVRVESVFELSSDHSPIIATVDAHVLPRVPPPALTTQHTDWEEFRSYINAHITLNLRLKERQELDDATHQFTTLLQNAAWHSTPPSRAPAAPSSGTPLHIRDLVLEKRRSRSRWQRSHKQGDRAIYNRLKRKLQTAH